MGELVHLTRFMISQFNEDKEDSSSPMLVHCSAGVGRTGTFISLDQILRAIDNSKTNEVDIFHTVYKLRRERKFMVQTRAQYEYIYKCAHEYISRKEKLSTVSEV